MQTLLVQHYAFPATSWSGLVLLGEPSIAGIALFLLLLCGMAILAKAIFCHGTRIVGFVGSLAGALLLGYLLFGFVPGSHTSPRRSHLEKIRRDADREARAVEKIVERITQHSEKINGKGMDYEEALNQLNKPRIRLVEGSDGSVHSLTASIELEVDSDVEAGNNAETSRPAWVDKARTRVGDVQRRVVKVGPWESVAECHRELGIPVLEATREYMQQEFTQKSDSGEKLSLENLRSMGINEAYVLQEICTDEFVETSKHEFGGEDSEMKWLHVLMEFSPSVRKSLHQGLLDYQRQQKATLVSLVAGAVIGAIGLVYGLLKVDTWTKGYYSRRLWIGVPATVVAALTAIALMA